MADTKPKTTNAGAFKKGEKRPGQGRPRGASNKTTTALKDAILQAAEATGLDGKGKEGLTGYLKAVARNDVKAFAALLGKVLPLQLTGPGENGEHLFQLIERRIVKP
jgi:hypothetical protein